MVTWTAIALGILQYPRQSHSRQRRRQAKDIIGNNVGSHQQPLALFGVSHGLESETGKRSEPSAEADDDQQSPARIGQNSLACPDHEPAHNEAAEHIDYESSVRENGSQHFGCVAAQNIAEDRKSTRLNSSHTVISYAVFCLKKKTSNLGSSRDHAR